MTAILNENIHHNHEEDSTRTTERQRLRQQCKRKATDDPYERPSKIIMKEISNEHEQSESQLIPKDIVSVRMAMYRERRRSQPALPKSLEETLDILSSFTLTSCTGEKKDTCIG